MYPGITELAGAKDNFVQEFVEHDGHCTILPPEIARGFSELRDWKNSGTRPPSGLLPQ